MNPRQERHEEMNYNSWTREELNEYFGRKSYWKCSLCTMELVDDRDITQRMSRHRDFHDPKTTGYRRNITYGKPVFERVVKE